MIASIAPKRDEMFLAVALCFHEVSELQSLLGPAARQVDIIARKLRAIGARPDEVGPRFVWMLVHTEACTIDGLIEHWHAAGEGVEGEGDA